MSDDVFMDPLKLRRIAERMRGDREFDYRPKLDEITKQLTDDGSHREQDLEGRPAGFIYGRSGIGAHHDQCLAEVITLFDSIDKGYIAMSNVLATAAEDFVKTDGDADSEITNSITYFRPPATESDSGDGRAPI